MYIDYNIAELYKTHLQFAGGVNTGDLDVDDDWLWALAMTFTILQM